MLRAINGYDGYAMTGGRDNDTFARASQEIAGEIPMDKADHLALLYALFIKGCVRTNYDENSLYTEKGQG